MEDEEARAGGWKALTAEELAGRLLRALRQGRGWSQQEVADRMKPFGYNWMQSTVGKIEGAQRPLRVNELADLAILFGVPASQMLEPLALPGADDGPRDVRDEILRLQQQHRDLLIMRDAAHEQADMVHARAAALAAALARVEASLDLLRRREPDGGRGDG